MHSAVAIVESPFQYMSALEYCEEFEVERLHVFYLANGDKTGLAQFKRVSDSFREVIKTEVNVLERKGLIGFISAYREIRSLFSGGKKSILLLGNYKSVYQRMIESRVFARTIVVDDGIAILDAIEAIVSGTEKYTSDSPKFRALSRFVSKRRRKHYEIFSMLSLELLAKYGNLLPKDYASNDLSVLRGSVAVEATTCVPSYDLGVVGGPYVEVGSIDPEDYFESIRSAIQRIGAESVVYIPHRRENKCSALALCERLGCALHETAESIEMSLLGGSLQCDSFLLSKSAAGLSIHKLFPEIELFFLPPLGTLQDPKVGTTEGNAKVTLQVKLDDLFSQLGVILD